MREAEVDGGVVVATGLKCERQASSESASPLD